MKLLITPYPSSVVYQEGTVSSKLFTECKAKQGGPLQTAIHMIGTEGETRVDFEPQLEEVEAEYTANEEGYRLRIDKKGVTIYAEGEAGYLYGVVTLMQLIKQFPEKLPCLVITDQPKWQHRGAQVCYAQINVEYKEEWLKKFIRELAFMKINTLYLYLEWRFWFDSIPATHNKAYMNKEDVQVIENLCKAYAIKVVPAINVMGHTEDFLGLEVFQDLKEYDAEKETLMTAHSAALCPNNPKTRKLIEKALDNLMNAFESPVIHIGGDEVEKIGVCPVCREIKSKHGVGHIYMEYLNWIRLLLKERKRKMGIWGDMLTQYLDQAAYAEESVKQLIPDTIVYHWSYDGPAKESLKALRAFGFDVICSTSTHTCSVGTVWPGQAINQQQYFKDGFELKCSGGLVTDWINGWSMHAENSGLNYAMAAALMWQGTDENFALRTTREDIEKAYFFQKYGKHAETMSKLIHLQGDPKSDLLKLFIGQKNGSYLRKAAYLSTNPMQVYMHYNGCLGGERLKVYRKAVEQLESIWESLNEKLYEDSWFIFQKQGVILHRYLLEKYSAIDEMASYYRQAAMEQWEEQENFMKALDKCVAHLKEHVDMFDAPYQFIEMCHERLGLEKGSLLRIEKCKANYRVLYEFLESLKDSHRPLPSLRNIADWLFEAPTTGFWESRNDEWYEESERFRRVEIDGKIEWGSARW